MSIHAYHEIYLHLTWHTKHNQPILTPEIEDRLQHYLVHRSCETPGVFIYEIGGTKDHLHLAVRVPPTLLLSDWIGKLKGASSHYINHHIADHKVLEWQVGYGVVSFGARALPWVRRYIQRQKEHHANGTITQRLEVIASDPLGAKALGE